MPSSPIVSKVRKTNKQKALEYIFADRVIWMSLDSYSEVFQIKDVKKANAFKTYYPLPYKPLK